MESLTDKIINLYNCPSCGKLVERESSKEEIKGWCGVKETPTVLILVKNEHT